MSAAHGGQIVVSSVTAELLRGEPGGELALADLGERYLRDVSTSTYAFQLDSVGASRRFPPLRSVESSGGNLPIQASRFFGRGDEITEIVKRLGDADRLVTLVGAGGIGKTRLALQASAELVGQLVDGVLVRAASGGDRRRCGFLRRGFGVGGYCGGRATDH